MSDNVPLPPNSMIVPPPPPPPPPPALPEAKETGGEVVNLSTAVTSVSALSRAWGIQFTVVQAMLRSVTPFYMDGKQSFYRLIDVTRIFDARKAEKSSSDEKDFTGDKPPLGATPAELKTYYQAKKEEQSWIKQRNDNAIMSGQLLLADDVQKTLIETYKVVVHSLDNLGDIFEREGIITSHEVTKVDELVDKLRQQMADDLRKLTDGEVDDV